MDIHQFWNTKELSNANKLKIPWLYCDYQKVLKTGYYQNFLAKNWYLTLNITDIGYIAGPFFLPRFQNLVADFSIHEVEYFLTHQQNCFDNTVDHAIKKKPDVTIAISIKTTEYKQCGLFQVHNISLQVNINIIVHMSVWSQNIMQKHSLCVITYYSLAASSKAASPRYDTTQVNTRHKWHVFDIGNASQYLDNSNSYHNNIVKVLSLNVICHLFCIFI